jgi:hypothetical protein
VISKDTKQMKGIQMLGSEIGLNRRSKSDISENQAYQPKKYLATRRDSFVVIAKKI